MSFQHLCEGQSRDQLVKNAQLLADAGIRVHAIDDQRGLLVRSDDVTRASAVLQGR